MQINRHMVIPLDGFHDVAQIMGVPRGDLFEFGINPFNGNIVVSWQDHPTARFFIRLVLAQLASYPDMFDERAIKAIHSGSISADEFEFSEYDRLGDLAETVQEVA